MKNYMELNLKRESVRDTATIVRLSAVSEESGDVVVPDSLPDIIRIVETDAHIELKNRETRGGKLYAEAVAHVSAIYVPETGGGLCRLAVSLPLATTFDLEGVADAAPQTTLRAELLNAVARELNPRKISVKAVCNFTCAVFESREPTLCTGLEDGGAAEIKTESRRVHLTSGVYEKLLSVSDSTELAAAAADCSEILKYDTEIRTTDCKQIKNKVILKGEVAVSLLTLGSGEEKIVKNTEAVIPFAGVVDCDGVTEETAVDLSYQIADCELNIVTESGTNRPLLAAKMNLLVGVEVWEEREICYISDAYSVSCPMECETEALKFRAAGRPVDICQAGRETISSGVTIKSVYMCSVSAENGAYHQTETGWEAAADVKIKLILEAEDGGVYSLVKNVAVSAPADGGAFEVGALTVTDKSFHISGNEDVEIRFTAVFHLLPAGGETFTQISAMRLLEPETKNKRQPSLTLCYAGAGESFWQLGKRLSATVADIQTANGLSGEFPPDGKLLLVPRRSQTEGRL